MADILQLRGLRMTGRHGVLEFEQGQSQPFQLDIDVEIDSRQAGQSDDLGDTFDYSAVLPEIASIFATESHRLIERVVERVAEVVLRDPRALAVDVTLTKLRPPVPFDLSSAGIHIHRP